MLPYMVRICLLKTRIHLKDPKHAAPSTMQFLLLWYLSFLLLVLSLHEIETCFFMVWARVVQICYPESLDESQDIPLLQVSGEHLYNSKCHFGFYSHCIRT